MQLAVERLVEQAIAQLRAQLTFVVVFAVQEVQGDGVIYYEIGFEAHPEPPAPLPDLLRPTAEGIVDDLKRRVAQFREAAEALQSNIVGAPESDSTDGEPS